MKCPGCGAEIKGKHSCFPLKHRHPPKKAGGSKTTAGSSFLGQLFSSLVEALKKRAGR